MAAKKPAGWNAFAKLARAVVKADSAAVDAKMAADKKARAKARRKKR